MTTSEHTSTKSTLAELRVSDAMHAGVLTCPMDAPLEMVAEMMASYGIHCVVVYKEPGVPVDGFWGVVSDLDLIAIAADGDVATRTAGSAAATPALRVSCDDTLDHAAQLMREYAISHLVVVDPDSDTPLGVLSTLDIARSLAGRG